MNETAWGGKKQARTGIEVICAVRNLSPLEWKHLLERLKHILSAERKDTITPRNPR